MFRGGYKIIDLTGLDITTGGAAVTVPGIYERIEGNYGKATLLSGLVLDSVEKNEAYVIFTVSGSDYVTTVYGVTITVKEDDSVTVAAA